MGKADVAVRQWLSDKGRFADLFNGVVFQGEEVVLAGALEEQKEEASLIVTDQNINERTVQKYRDIVMRWNGKLNLAVLAIEAQDKIYPVITLVFYYDMKEWDAAIDLYDMMGIKAEVEKYPLLKQYISNYHINLIDAERIEKPEMFRTDLHEVLGMLRYRGDKSGLQTYVNDNESYFSNLDQDSYYAIGSFLKSKRLLKKIEADNQGRKEIRLNMCKALEELYEDGIEQGKRDTAINLKRMGLTLDQIAQAVEENVSVVRVWLEGSKLKK